MLPKSVTDSVRIWDNGVLIPWDERPKLNRAKLGKLLNGYINAAAESTFWELGLWDKYNIRESTLHQMVRDCAYLVGQQDVRHIDPKQCGYAFWMSRHNYTVDDFLSLDEPELHEYTKRFGPYLLYRVHNEITSTPPELEEW